MEGAKQFGIVLETLEELNGDKVRKQLQKLVDVWLMEKVLPILEAKVEGISQWLNDTTPGEETEEALRVLEQTQEVGSALAGGTFQMIHHQKYWQFDGQIANIFGQILTSSEEALLQTHMSNGPDTHICGRDKTVGCDISSFMFSLRAIHRSDYMSH